MNQQTSTPLRVLIADDHAMILEMFELYLAAVPDIELETAPDLHQVLDAIDARGPFDLVLVDLDMPGMDGVVGLGLALQRNGGRPVGVLTSSPTPQVVDEIMALGSVGILLKTASLKNLANEIRLMAGGVRYLPFELFERRSTPRHDEDSPLSKREFTVLGLLAEGRLNREIGEALNLAEPTVKMHVKSICTKLGAANRTQAVMIARDRHLI